MQNSASNRSVLSHQSVLILLTISVLALIGLGWPILQKSLLVSTTPTAAATSTLTATLSPTQTPTDTQAPPQPVAAIAASNLDGPLSQGLMVLSLQDGAYAHLFAYRPQGLPLTRLTNQPWDDITPALSPDGTQVAFSSKANGYFDLFLLNLASGQTTRLTDTAAYDANPTWSPDGRWLAFESYVDNNLEIYILSLEDLSQPAIRVTDDPGADFDPAWAPQGRQIAFVSNRTGTDQVWLADLDNVDNRFKLLSQEPNANQEHPAWSPDGNTLAWASTQDGMTSLNLWDSRQPDQPARRFGDGDWPVWSPDGSLIITRLQDPNNTYLAAYATASGELVLPPVAVSGSLHGMDWKNASLPAPLSDVYLRAGAANPAPLWQPAVTPHPEGPAGRMGLVDLKDVTAPYAMLNDLVDESFNALRGRVAAEAGWDYLASLENAYVPLTAPLAPGLGEDWLYTGRAIALDQAPMNAGWLVVAREDYGSQVYWRIFLKARYQDGSQGAPIHELTWDLNARYSGDPQEYEQGGSPVQPIPAGYWIDLTDLAAQYGWVRLPALIDWRTYYPGTRFNELVAGSSLDWKSAMLEIYPPEALETPTEVVPPSPTPTNTPWWLRPRTATPTPTPTITPTRRPTWTPIP